MKSLEELRQFFEGDRFAMGQGIRIDSVTEENAVCSVRLEKQHCNALGSAQGGLIFTLADFAFAVAANSGEDTVVTLSSAIEYLRPPKGQRLIATAGCYSRSSRVCRYLIEVADDLGTSVARVNAVGFVR